MSNIRYVYSEIDLLKHPQRYQMTPYEGLNFLVAYTKSRSKILNSLQNDVTSLDYIIVGLSSSKNFDVLNYIKKEFETNILFIKLVQNLKKESKTEIFDFIIDEFIRKFEIKKKLFTFYDNRFKETTSDFSNLQNYVLLSLICLHKYKHTKKLRYLNVVLKLNDLLCSQIQNINDPINSSLLYSVLRDELLVVSSLLEAKKIKIKK